MCTVEENAVEHIQEHRPSPLRRRKGGYILHAWLTCCPQLCIINLQSFQMFEVLLDTAVTQLTMKSAPLVGYAAASVGLTQVSVLMVGSSPHTC